MSETARRLGRIAFALALLVGAGVLIGTQVSRDNPSALLIWIGAVAGAFGGFLLFPEDFKVFLGLAPTPWATTSRRRADPRDADEAPP